MLFMHCVRRAARRINCRVSASVDPRWLAPAFGAYLGLGATLAFDTFNSVAPYDAKLARYYGAVSIPACPPELRP